MNRVRIGLLEKAFSLATLGVCALAFPGCHSAFVEATIDNQGTSPVRLVEVDYPSASFGVSSIESHSRFHYRFKIQGSGALKLEFTDAQGKLHDSDGPVVNLGQEGALSVVISPDGDVHWQPSLTTLR